MAMTIYTSKRSTILLYNLFGYSSTIACANSRAKYVSVFNRNSNFHAYRARLFYILDRTDEDGIAPELIQ